MPSWDRPRSGGDSGGDRQPSPRVPGYDSYVPPAAGTDRVREQAGGTSPKDKHAEHGAPEREGTAATETDGRPDKHADTLRQYKTLFERQSTLIDTQKERISDLSSDLGKRDAENDRLKSENARQAGTIERLESRITDLTAGPHEGTGPAEKTDQGPDKSAERVAELHKELEEAKASNAKLTNTVADLTETNSKLVDTNTKLMDKIGSTESERNEVQADVAEAKTERLGETDKPAEQQELPDGSVDEMGQEGLSQQEQTERQVKQQVGWLRRHVPSEKALLLSSSVGAAVDQILTTSHLMTSGEAGILGAVGTVVIAAIAWGRERHREKKNAN